MMTEAKMPMQLNVCTASLKARTTDDARVHRRVNAFLIKNRLTIIHALGIIIMLFI